MLPILPSSERQRHAMSTTLYDLIGTDQIAGNPTSESVPSIYRGPEHRSVRFSVPKPRFIGLNTAGEMSLDHAPRRTRPSARYVSEIYLRVLVSGTLVCY